MPAVSLSCRVCATEHPLVANGSCSQCFGPLDPTYDWDLLRGRVSRASIEAGPQSIWRYADLLPVSAPEDARLAPGMTPLVPAPRLAAELGIGELWLKLDTANPTHSFKDRVVAVAARKAQELGLDTLSCSSTGNLAGAVAARAAAEGLDAAVFVPERPRAGEARGRRGLRAADLRRQRHLRPLLAALGGAVVRAAVGLRQRQPALLLRGGLEDARLRDRGAARLGDAGRRRDPDRIGRSLPQGRPGVRRAAAARPDRRRQPDALRWPGGRVRAGRDRLPRRGSRRAGAARQHRAVARDRESRRRRLRRRDGARDGRRDLHRARGRDRAQHGRARRHDRRLRRDRDGRHARRAQGGGRGRPGRARSHGSCCSSRATG